MPHTNDRPLCQSSVGENLVDLLRHRSTLTGDKRAFDYISGDNAEAATITYRELHERAMMIGGRLQAMIAPGSRALLVFPPGLDFISAFFGCLYAGVIAVPVAPPGRNRFSLIAEPIFTAAKPSAVLSTARLSHEVCSAAHPPLQGLPWLTVDTIAGSSRHAWRDPQIDRSQIAVLQYTSGSTFAPKGVMLSHHNLLCNAALIQQAFGNTSESSAVFWLPLYHDMGLIGGVIQPIYCGGSCTLLAPAAFLQRPALWLETISRTRATVSGGPNFAFDLCARKIRPEERKTLDLSCWEVAFLGAERVRSQTLEQFAEAFGPCGFRRKAFFPCYGLAEATLMVSGGPRQVEPTVLHVDSVALARHRLQDISPDDPSSRSLVGCGENLPGQEVVIANPQTRLPCADGEVGEIWVRGPSVAQGYFDQPDATDASFKGVLADSNKGTFLRTGDLGFLRDGQLYVTGRLKDLIIIRGRNFYPEDIEYTAERACSGLRIGHCAAFSAEMDDREQLAIVQEVEPRRRDLDRGHALRAIRHAVAARHGIEVHAIALVKAGSIPMTSSGKTRRSACRDRYLSGEMEVLAEWKASLANLEEEVAAPSSAPRKAAASEIERWLIERMASRLRLDRSQVRSTTPFVDFGMSSVDAVEIAGELERWLGRPLSPTAIYNHPTVSALAQWLATATPEASAPTTQPCVGPAPLDQDPDSIRREVEQMTEQDLHAFLEQVAKQEVQ